MTNHELETQLKNALHSADAPVRPAHIRETLSLAQISLARKTAPKRLSYWGFLGTQVRFIGWKIWLYQAVTLMLLTGVVFSLFLSFTDNSKSVGILLSGCSFLIFLTALPFLYRSRRYQMIEVEMAAKVSGSKQLGAKLLIICIGDLSMLCSLFCFALARTDLEPGSVLLCLLLPFLASASGLLYLIGHTPGAKLMQNSVVVCGSLFLGSALLMDLPPIFLSSKAYPLWALVCILLALSCVFQTHGIFHDSSYEEVQLL